GGEEGRGGGGGRGGGYRGRGDVKKQGRPAHPSVAWELRSAVKKKRPAGQRAESPTMALCEDGQFIPRGAVYVHNQRSRPGRADLTSCRSVITPKPRRFSGGRRGRSRPHPVLG